MIKVFRGKFKHIIRCSHFLIVADRFPGTPGKKGERGFKGQSGSPGDSRDGRPGLPGRVGTSGKKKIFLIKLDSRVDFFL